MREYIVRAEAYPELKARGTVTMLQQFACQYVAA